MKDLLTNGEGSPKVLTPRESALAIFDSLEIDPANDLPGILLDYLAQPDVNGDDSNQIARDLISEGRNVEAFILLSQAVDVGPVSKSTQKSIRESRGKVKAALSGVLEKSPPPLTFRSGRDSHQMLEEVFAKTDGKYLNLITCEGVFDRASRNYSDRLVVFTELQE